MTQAAALVPTVRLFGQLLLRELDADLLAELTAPEVAAALTGVGVTLPVAGDLEALRSTYVDLFVHPERGAPPIGSLWRDGQYEGDSTIALRRIAEASGWQFDASAAAGSPIDHAGAVLLLWCACHETHPDLADLIAAEHMEWIPRAFAGPASGEGFYADVCRGVCALVVNVCDG